MKKIKSICVYCGSTPGNNPAFEAAAKAFGKSMAENGIELVYGGGTHGLMGIVSNAVKANGGQVTGIIPTFLLKRESSVGAMDYLDNLHVVDDMHTRKQMMFDKADAFVTLPGGVGTLEEVVEMLTWAQIGQHAKPIVLANFESYWNPLLGLFDHMVECGFLNNKHEDSFIVIDKADEIIPKLLASQT